MSKNRHLTLEGRITIEQKLKEQETFKEIARDLGKDPTTIAKEVRNHIRFQRTGCYGRPFNDCLHRKDCGIRYLCGSGRCKRLCAGCFLILVQLSRPNLGDKTPYEVFASFMGKKY